MDITDEYGNTALLLAAEKGFKNIVQLLLGIYPLYYSSIVQIDGGFIRRQEYS